MEITGIFISHYNVVCISKLCFCSVSYWTCSYIVFNEGAGLGIKYLFLDFDECMLS